MNQFLSLVILLAALDGGATKAGATFQPREIPASCKVTTPPEPAFVPPAPYPARPTHPGQFWYGSARLWTLLSSDGLWHGTPPDRGYRRGYRNKSFWWRPGYDGSRDPRPNLRVSAWRLDGPGKTAPFDPPTNAHHKDFGGWAMLTALDIPTTGCWEITGRVGEEAISFVVWVTAHS